METVTAAAALPDDLLAGVFGLLPARSLAASCGTCRAWRDLIDERQLLVRFRRLLPHSVHGLFINYEKNGRSTYFLSRPMSSSPENFSSRRIDGKFDFITRELPEGATEVVDHCNGLVLFLDSRWRVLHVCNPTTRWSARLSRLPGGGSCGYSPSVSGRRAFLVFDPFVSPEYKVLLSPVEPVRTEPLEADDDDPWRLMEWPPSAWKAWHEFSSSTGRWEKKVFVREGEAAGTAGDHLLDEFGFKHVELAWRYAAYWKGALYIHCHGEYVSRFSLLDDKYRVMKSPIELAQCKNGDVRTFLGRSEKGVYIAAIAEDGLPKLRVWTLSESGAQMEWVPMHQGNLKINTYSWWIENKKFDGSKFWILDLESEHWMFHPDTRRKNQDVSLEENVYWNFDDDNIIDVSDDEPQCDGYVKFLGFHPYKKVIFLCRDHNVVACHLNNTKVQYLGTVNLGAIYNRGIRESFVYTPCLIGVQPCMF